MKNFLLIYLRRSFLLLAFFSFNVAHSQISCVQNQQVFLDQNCQAVILPQDVLADVYNDYSSFVVEILDANGQSMNTPVASAQMLSGSWGVRVTDTQNGQSCTVSSMQFLDTIAPTISCESRTDTVFCNMDLAEVIQPTGWDNCNTSITMHLVSENYVDANICDDDALILKRVWEAVDASNNHSTSCVQSIVIKKTNIEFPSDIVWTYNQYSFFPNIIDIAPVHESIFDLDEYDGQNDIDVDPGLSAPVLTQSGSGVVKGGEDASCKYVVSYTDEHIQGCKNSFHILRTWTVNELCSGVTFSHVQKVSIKDETSNFSLAGANGYEQVGAHYEYHMNAQDTSSNDVCHTTGFVFYPLMMDGVDTQSIVINTAFGPLVNTNSEGGYIPSPGYPFGTYPDGLELQVSDTCGNVETLLVTLVVEDTMAPVAICVNPVSITLNSTGNTVLDANFFDGGSTDNCCISSFEVKRQTSNCASTDLQYGSDISFCCDDIGQTVPVQMRVTDCYGNTSVCEVQVQVAGNTAPQCLAPPNATTSCQNFDPSLSSYGSMTATGGCGMTIDSTNASVDWSQFQTACQTGVITRYWSVWDQDGNTSSCLQKITVIPVLSYNVQFPDDVTDGSLDTLAPIVTGNCGPISWSVQDVKDIVSGDCTGKIYRTYTVSNDCDFDSNYQAQTVTNPTNTTVGAQVVATSQNHGYFLYTQVIDIFDESAPTLECGEDSIEICTELNTCSSQVTLSCFASDDFVDASDLVFNYYYQLYAGSTDNYDILVSSNDANAPEMVKTFVNGGVQVSISLGVLNTGSNRIVWTVSDGCGHTEIQERVFFVRDCQKPSMTCHALLDTISLNDFGKPEITVPYTEILTGLSDNCTAVPYLQMAMTQNGAQPVFDDGSSFVLGCDDIGSTLATVWAKDAAGNVQNCETTITVVDVDNFCDRRMVTGNIHLENGIGVKNVDVEAVSSNSNHPVFSTTTDYMGNYSLELPIGADYLIKPSKTNDTYQNGVDMADVTVLYNHILATPQLSSVYQVLAANVLANNSAALPELLEIRKLVLNKIQEFDNVPVWTFADSKVQFPDIFHPYNIHYTNHSIGNLADNQNIDFVAIKYGDLNNSTNGQLKEKKMFLAKSRGEDVVPLVVDNLYLKEGQEYLIPFNFLAEKEILSYQFTINFDLDALEFLQVEADPKVIERDFNIFRASEGLIATAHLGVLPENQPVCALRFRAKSSGFLSKYLGLSDAITPSRAFDSDLEPIELKIDFQEKPKVDLELFQNEPNPFADITTISFELQKEEKLSLTIYAADGRVVEKREKTYPSGFHREIFLGSLFEEKGIYYYRIETQNGIYIKKMIKM